jgi:deazaflavin-dependent oxidoreductase (nitroreductase family)
LLNLEAKPEVKIQVARQHLAGRATAVRADDPEYSRLWKLVNDNNHNRYNGYQSKTARPIPVVVVTPAA